VYFGSVVVRDLRALVFGHLQVLSLGYFGKREVGALMARLSNDVSLVEILMVDGIQFTVINALLAAGIGVMLLAMNWKLGLLALLPAPMLMAFSVWFWGKVRGLFGRRWEMYSRFSSFLNDSLGGVRVVKAFGKEAEEVKRFGIRNTELYHATVGAEIMWVTWRPILGILMQTGTLLVWYFGGRQVLNQQITPGTLVAFAAYLGMLYGPIMMLTQINNFLTSCFSATERVFEILDAKPDVKDAPGAVELPRITGSVELKNVTFGYDALKPVLKALNLEVKPGEMVGLVGPSGAGKSTTINLICRLYDVQEGAVLIDGQDLKSVTQESLRRQIGIVLQETYLFNGTIAENIAYSHPQATRGEIIGAAVTARAHDFIMGKPDGYDTLVGDRGGNLSGGEKQRVAIARAILHNPRLLILDEATSSVDTATETEIQQALVNLMKDRTTFAIAHRLSTLRRANRLVVLENGKIIETGTHDELVGKKGTYAKLVEAQADAVKVMTLTE
jgi:ATP-binding cassette subfamily B protein